MKFHFARGVVFLPVLISLVSCSLLTAGFGRRVAEADDYVITKTTSTLVVPDDLQHVRVSDTWQLPPIEEYPSAKVYDHKAPRPSALYGETDPDVIRIQKLGDRQWMVLQQTPDVVWPMVKQFLDSEGVSVTAEDSEQGLIVTETLGLSSDHDSGLRGTLWRAKEKSKAIFGEDWLVWRVEQGLRRRSAEVHVRHVLSSDDEAQPQIEWPSESFLVDVERDALDAFTQFTASGKVERAASILGQSLITQTKSEIVRDAEGQPSLRLRIDFERAWATVGRALDKAEIEVAEKKRDNGVYQIVINERALSDRRDRFLERLISAGKSSDRLTLLLEIVGDGDVHEVTVSTVDGGPLSVEFTERMLALIQELSV